MSILLLKVRRRFRVGCADCVAGFVSIPGCWIVLWGCVDSGCVDLVAGFVFMVCFSGFVTGGLCGFRCDTGVGRWLWVDGCVGKEINILFE